MNIITAIVVDDERPAREEMLELLKEFPSIEVVAVCRNVAEAKIEITRFSPDVIFLDVSMPPQSGFDLLDELKLVPEIVFVTAYDEYAIRAFEQSALDYLLKPVTHLRLTKTIDRINSKVSAVTLNTRKLFVRDGTSYSLVPLAEVYLVEAFGNYVKLFYQNRFAVYHCPLKESMRFFPQGNFIQVNRSQLVNVEFITSIDKRKQKLEIILSGKMISVSTRRASVVKEFLRIL